jgi:cell wall-associated NlpC family hydrolase
MGTKHQKPGDVVSTGEHVGIYIGNGKMISAARDKIVMTDLKSYENYTYRHYEGTLLDSILNDVINNHQSNN